MHEFESLPSLPYLNNVFTSKQRVYTAIETRGVSEVDGSKNGNHTWQIRMYRYHSSMWSQPTLLHFFTTICSTSKNGGELRTETYTSASISVIHQAALEGT